MCIGTAPLSPTSHPHPPGLPLTLRQPRGRPLLEGMWPKSRGNLTEPGTCHPDLAPAPSTETPPHPCPLAFPSIPSPPSAAGKDSHVRKQAAARTLNCSILGVPQLLPVTRASSPTHRKGIAARPRVPKCTWHRQSSFPEAQGYEVQTPTKWRTEVGVSGRGFLSFSEKHL